jgi:hypothetical protein
MLIASQNPTATNVAGFHTWHKLGRFVKKGEKGILILAPIVRAKNQGAEQTETDESSTAVGFRAAYVFDISQTDGQELPEIGNVNGDPREHRERLGKFVTDQGILLEYSQDIAPARGTSAGGKITLLPGQTPAEEFATLAHEVAHLCSAEIYVALISDCPRKTAWKAGQAPHNWGSQVAEKLHYLWVVAPCLSRMLDLASVTGGQGLCLHFQINLGIDVGGIDGDVAEPGTDGVDVDACTEEMSCRGVPDCVGADALPY